jgi:FkbM family methyltransferase
MNAAAEGPYAQFGEDRILEGIFGAETNGYCVEVGAYDGRTGSATYLFERRGWNCLLIEPVPELAAEIRQHRRCVIKNCAASSQEGEVPLFVADSVEQMSTLELTNAHRRWIHQVGGTIREITVRTATLDTLLSEAGFPKVDFITIDVEGHELDVLRGFDLTKHKPRILIVEANAGQPSVTSYLAEIGYINFKRTGVNEWYAHKDDAELVNFAALKRFRRAKVRSRVRQALISAARQPRAWLRRMALRTVTKRW